LQVWSIATKKKKKSEVFFVQRPVGRSASINYWHIAVHAVYAGSKCHSFILPFIHFVSVVTLLLAFYFAAQLYSFV